MFPVYFAVIIGALIIIALISKGLYNLLLGERLWSKKRDPDYWNLIKKVESQKKEVDSSERIQNK